MTTIVLSCISVGGEEGGGFYEMQRDAANIELLTHGWIIKKAYCSSQPSMVNWLSSPTFPCSFIVPLW